MRGSGTPQWPARDQAQKPATRGSRCAALVDVEKLDCLVGARLVIDDWRQDYDQPARLARDEGAAVSAADGAPRVTERVRPDPGRATRVSGAKASNRVGARSAPACGDRGGRSAWSRIGVAGVLALGKSLAASEKATAGDERR